MRKNVEIGACDHNNCNHDTTQSKYVRTFAFLDKEPSLCLPESRRCFMTRSTSLRFRRTNTNNPKQQPRHPRMLATSMPKMNVPLVSCPESPVSPESTCKLSARAQTTRWACADTTHTAQSSHRFDIQRNRNNENDKKR